MRPQARRRGSVFPGNRGRNRGRLRSSSRLKVLSGATPSGRTGPAGPQHSSLLCRRLLVEQGGVPGGCPCGFSVSSEEDTADTQDQPRQRQHSGRLVPQELSPPAAPPGQVRTDLLLLSAALPRSPSGVKLNFTAHLTSHHDPGQSPTTCSLTRHRLTLALSSCMRVKRGRR